MMDTGAAPNLMKQHKLNPGTHVNNSKLLHLIGITDCK